MSVGDYLADLSSRASAFGIQRRRDVFRMLDLLKNPPPIPTRNDPRRFVLQRNKDMSGISGVGNVAWGTEFPNGKVALTWSGSLCSQTWFDSLSVLEKIHGHNGTTEIVWIDDK